MTIQVRLAQRQDIPEIEAVVALSARSLQGPHYSAEQVDAALGVICALDTQLITDGTYFVAVEGDQIVGCGGWSARKTLYGNSHAQHEQAQQAALLDPAMDAARIRAFYVHPGFQRRGIGRLLMQQAEAAAKKAGFKRMELVSTLVGEPLYAKMAYQAGERFEIPLENDLGLAVVSMVKEFVQPAAEKVSHYYDFPVIQFVDEELEEAFA
jgi:GNAT superfamily N-acetyltransferase